MRRSREVYGYITDVTEIADDGWYGNPAWADEERAGQFAATVSDEIAGDGRVHPGDAEAWVVTVVGPGELEFRDFPGGPPPTRSRWRVRVLRPCARWSSSMYPPDHHISTPTARRSFTWWRVGAGSGWTVSCIPWARGPGTAFRAGTPHATMADPNERMSLVCFFPHDDFANNIEELDVLLEADEEQDR